MCYHVSFHLNVKVFLVAIYSYEYFFSSMPDMSDVGAPAKGPGLPHRVPEAPPPPVRVKIEHG